MGRQFIEENLLESCRTIIEIYSKGTNPLIYQDEDGLIFSGSPSVNTSWFPIGGENNGIPEIYVRSLSDMTLGNEDLELANDLLVYPNPAKDEFRIKSSSQVEKSITIINMVGKIIYNKLIRNDEPIDISYLSSGIYLLKIEEGTKFTTLKLVKE